MSRIADHASSPEGLAQPSRRQSPYVPVFPSSNALIRVHHSSDHPLYGPRVAPYGTRSAIGTAFGIRS